MGLEDSQWGMEQDGTEMGGGSLAPGCPVLMPMASHLYSLFSLQGPPDLLFAGGPGHSPGLVPRLS